MVHAHATPCTLWPFHFLLVPCLHCFLIPLWHGAAARLLHKLDFLTVVAVRDLTITYSMGLQGGQEAASAPVPAAVLQHDMQLLVAPDRPGLYLEMAQQLAR
jgi:hypothetical protein